MKRAPRTTQAKNGPSYLQPLDEECVLPKQLKKTNPFEFEEWHKNYIRECIDRRNNDLWVMEWDDRADWRIFERVKQEYYEQFKNTSNREIRKFFEREKEQAKENLDRFKEEIESKQSLPQSAMTFEEVKAETEYKAWLETKKRDWRTVSGMESMVCDDTMVIEDKRKAETVF